MKNKYILWKYKISIESQYIEFYLILNNNLIYLNYSNLFIYLKNNKIKI